MKKLLLATIISLTFSLSLSAFAWSGLIDNTTKATENHDFSVMGLNQGNGIYFSLSHNLSENGSLRLAAEGLYKYSLYCDMKTNKFVFKNIADLDSVKLYELMNSRRVGKDFVFSNRAFRDAVIILARDRGITVRGDAFRKNNTAIPQDILLKAMAWAHIGADARNSLLV